MTDRQVRQATWRVVTEGSLGPGASKVTTRRRTTEPELVRAVLEAAPGHGLPGAVGEALRGLDRSGRADDLRRGCLEHHVRVVATLAQLASALDGTSWLSFKGPALAWGSWSRPTTRWGHDLDVLVPAAELAEADARLRAAGFATVERNWSLVQRLRLGQIHLVGPTGVTVDLHHDVVHHGRVRDRFPLRTEQLLSRSRPVEVAGVTVPTLDPVDTVLHLALHTCTSGAQRLSWYLDVHRAVAAAWDELPGLPARAAETGLAVPALLVLSTAARLGTPLPPGVLAALGGRGPNDWLLRVMSRLVDLVEPPGAVRRHMSPRRSLHQSVAATSGATVLEVVRRLRDAALVLVLPAARTLRQAPRPSLAEEDPRGERARAAWLSESVAAAQPGGPRSPASS